MIALDRVSKSFGTRTVIQEVSFQFPDGERIALIGANGAGKTTLLNMICGTETLDGGQVITPQNTRIGYLPQEPNPNPKGTVLDECVAGARFLASLQVRMERSLAQASEQPEAADHYAQAEASFRLHGGYELVSRAQRILHGLGFSEEQQQKSPKDLSGGWRMRLELARVLIDDPEILVLDEPTNHLDLPSLAWVERYLERFRGTVLFVSHDRALLDRLATVTVHLQHGLLRSYPGGFTKFLEQSAAAEAQREAELASLQRKRESMERFVERFGAKASKATQAQSRLKMIARIRAVESDLAPDESVATMSMPLRAGEPSGRSVCEMKELQFGYSRPLTRPLSLLIERGQRIAVIGANGLGKSTLLRTIVGSHRPLGGSAPLGHNVRLAYFAQDQLEVFAPEDELLGAMLRETPLGQAEARHLLGCFLFSGDDVHKRVKVLSGGERSRLGLARALAQNANFLVLDEPTNHLDMASVEILGASLAEFSGTVLFVSHDRQFIDAICTHILALTADGQAMLFPGQLADYARLAVQAGFPNILEDEAENRSTLAINSSPESSSNKQSDHQAAKQLKSRKQKLMTQIGKLETQMQSMAQSITDLESQMAAVAPSDFARLQELSGRIQRQNSERDAAEETWLTLSAELEEVSQELDRMGRGGAV